MTLDTALRTTEVMMALAFIQQSAEHLAAAHRDRMLFAIRILLCLMVLANWWPLFALVGLAGVSLAMLHRFDGPYNGGGDRMSVLILWCVMTAQVMPNLILKEAVFGYLAFQLLLSYVISGKVKLMNPEWRSGVALRDVFSFSAYPVSEDLRRLAQRPGLLWASSWCVILFEVLFPLCLIHPVTLTVALCGSAMFHLANACLFGLNRFFWIWLAAYPSLIWFQMRVVGGW